MSVNPIETDPMNDSILNTVKKVLSLPESYDAFDVDIMLFVNSVFSNLAQLGVGPEDGFVVTGPSQKWGDFLGVDKELNNIKTYMVLKVRMYFDPPTTPHTIAAFEKIIAEQEFRISVHREGTHWVHPEGVMGGTVGPDPFDDVVIIDGGIVG